MAVPVVFIANGIMFWLIRTFLVAALAGFAIMFPDVVLGIVVDVMQFLADIVSNSVGIGDLPDIQEAFDALPIEVREAMVRIRLPEGLAIIVVAYGLSFVGWIWRMLYVVKLAP